MKLRQIYIGGYDIEIEDIETGDIIPFEERDPEKYNYYIADKKQDLALMEQNLALLKRTKDLMIALLHHCDFEDGDYLYVARDKDIDKIAIEMVDEINKVIGDIK